MIILQFENLINQNKKNVEKLRRIIMICLGLNNFEALKIGKSRIHLLKLFTTNFTYTQSLPSSSPMSQTS